MDKLLEAALVHFEAGLRLDGGHVPTLLDMSVALLRKGDIVRAEMLCREALRLDGCSALGYNTLALALSAQGRFGSALKTVRLALFYGPELACVHRTAARLLRGQGQTHRAIIHYLKLLDVYFSYTYFI